MFSIFSRTLKLAMAAVLLMGNVRADTADPAGLPLLKPLTGKVVLLDFWASWCEPCRKSLPWMDALQKQYGDSGLVVVAVNLDQDRALAEKFLRATPVRLRIEYDSGGHLARALEVQVMPTSFLIDRRGAIRERHRGFRVAQREERERQIVQLLQESPP